MVRTIADSVRHSTVVVNICNLLSLSICYYVPVRTLARSADNMPLAIARFTAENTASSEAVMMFGCMPAPNSVCRERVVISIKEMACAALPVPRECS